MFLEFVCLGAFSAPFWLYFGTVWACGGLLWSLVGPNGRKGKNKLILGGHIFGSSGSLLASCWIILGVFFINVLPGMFMGGDLAPKLGHLGVENVCVLCKCRQNQHVGEIRRRSTFLSLWGRHLGGIWEPWGLIEGIWRGCWLLLWRVGFGVRF